MNPMLKHQIRIALATLKMSSASANIAGGPNKKEAVEILEKYGKLPVKCYDDGDETFDRYTVAFTYHKEQPNVYECLCMSSNPFWPQGFCQHTVCIVGPHLGKRIRFADLPPDCQTAVRRDLEA
jgi:hypothetical protein